MNTYQQARTGTRILELSEFFRRLPFGRWLRNQLLRKTIPLSRTLDFSVIELLPGHCVATLKEHSRIQNEHYCVHETVIAALAEHVARLAMLTGLPTESSATLTGWSIQFHKVGHGKLTAECKCPLPQAELTKEFHQLIEVRDQGNAVVARASSQWLISHTGSQSMMEG